MKLFHNFTDQELARLLELVSMSDDDFFLRFSDPSTHETSSSSTSTSGLIPFL